MQGGGQAAVTAWVAVATFAGVLASSCESVRRHTYPPDFHYVPGAELRSTMDRMARDVSELDVLLRRPEAIDEASRARVVELLRSLEADAARLGPAGEKTNHPRLDERLPKFRSDLDLARRGAELDPPNYFLAGAVTGMCLHCHERR